MKHESAEEKITTQEILDEIFPLLRASNPKRYIFTGKKAGHTPKPPLAVCPTRLRAVS